MCFSGTKAKAGIVPTLLIMPLWFSAKLWTIYDLRSHAIFPRVVLSLWDSQGLV